LAKTILVAEDRDASRESICTVLTAAGHAVISKPVKMTDLRRAVGG
jgi:hypothetical protein